MKSIQYRFLIAAAAVLLGTAFANSQTADTTTATPPPQHHFQRAHARGGWGPNGGFFADYLDLTDAQRTQMKTIMQKEHSTMKPLMQQMHQTRQQLRQYEEGTFDEAKVRALAAQQAQTQVELTVAQTRIHSEMFQVLTADQQAKMKEFEAKREARMQKHMQEHSAPPATPEEQQQ
jgi:Spy/CpxP family protein refolding chaperone